MLGPGKKWVSQMALVVKNPPVNVGDLRDLRLIPGSGRSPGEGNGNPFQYSFWEIPWTEEPGGLHTVHKIAKTQTQLSN